MAYADIIFLECCIGLGYFLLMMALLLLGLMQGNWQNTSTQHVLSFRKPSVLRLGSGMASLLFLAIGGEFVTAVNFFGIGMTWFWNIPISLIAAGLLTYTAGPQDVFIDLNTRTCQTINGWMFHPKKCTFALTKASCVGVCPGGSSYYVLLILGDGTNKRFLLARPGYKCDAITAAHEFADRLHLPVKETSLQGLRTLG